MAVFAMFGMFTGIFLSLSVLHIMDSLNAPETINVSSDAEVAELSGEIMQESAPIRLVIPSADIDTSFEGPLGLAQNGEVEVPESYTEVGWYQYGPTPGELGPAVILGHVDSISGPAVFFRLGQVKIGDEIRVEREDGTTAVFEVTHLERPAQAEFPTQEVYGDINHAGLRLITCTGTYNRGILRYSHNLIVYARLVDAVETKIQLHEKFMKAHS